MITVPPPLAAQAAHPPAQRLPTSVQQPRFGGLDLLADPTTLMAAKTLGATALGGGLIGTTWALILRHKRQNEAFAIARRPLALMKSAYPLTKKNAISVETIKALLDHDKGLDVEAKVLEPAVEHIARALVKSLGKEAFTKTVIPVLVEKGLAHPAAEIRRKTVQTLLYDGLTREDMKPFMALLNVETEPMVIEALGKPILQLALPEDTPQFKAVLLNDKAPVGARTVSASVLAQFKDAGAMAVLFDALTLDNPPELVDTLQTAIQSLAEEANSPLLVEKLTHQLVDVKQAAVDALGSLKNPRHFSALHQAFADNMMKSMDGRFKEALQASVSLEHIPLLAEALHHPKLKVQAAAISLLGHLKHPSVVPVLMDYLAEPETRFPAEATTALAECVTQENRSHLLEVIRQYDAAHTDKEPMLAALEGIGRIAHPEDAAVLRQALHMDSVVKQAAVQSFTGYGVESLAPLVDTLEKTTAQTPAKEKKALMTAIQKVARHESAIPMLMEKALSHHGEVKKVASQGLQEFLQKWQEMGHYDKPEVMTPLRQLAQHQDRTLQAQAKRVYQEMIQEKVQELAVKGSRGKFSWWNDDYRHVKSLQNAPETEIKMAAKQALATMDARRSRHRDEQLRLAGEVALVVIRILAVIAEVAASSSGSSRSGGGGGSWGGGGGRSSGGGGGWGGGGSGRAGGGRSI